MIKQNQLDDSSKFCNAKTRAGTPCRRPAGWGTDHVGEGRCKLHGGKSTGPKNQKKNKNAEKHGLFSKHIPEETMEIMDSLEINTIDMLWDNIKIQYAAIIRAQEIMFVKNKDELVKEVKSYKELPDGTILEEYEIQYAWDRHEKFMNSQARAMNNLTNMIMKYEDLCRSELVTEEQITRIEKLKVEIDTMKGIAEEIEDLTDVLSDIYEKKENN